MITLEMLRKLVYEETNILLDAWEEQGISGIGYNRMWELLSNEREHGSE
jgi:hypothetical protein